jgi:peptide/nickel transport system ATP-binding protein
MAVILITHDLGVIAETPTRSPSCTPAASSSAPLSATLRPPGTPYTRGLLESIPRLDSTPKTKLPAIPGQVAAITDFVEGCRFAQRLGLDPGPTRPPFIEAAPGHWVEAQA